MDIERGTLAASLRTGLRLPLFAAPMFLVSGPALVVAACRAGVIGTFPTPNARTVTVLEEWLDQITRGLAKSEGTGASAAPWAANVVTHRSNDRLEADLELVARYRAPIVITALGGPAPALDIVHQYGGVVFADVNSIDFAQKAVAAGADGLVLVAAGAGGHTGNVSGFAFVSAVREFFDGPIALAGAISDGGGVRAAEVLGADFAYMGTSFIATTESLAPAEYKAMLVDAGVGDIMLTAAFTGVPANMLIPSIRRRGLDPANLAPRRDIDFTDPQNIEKAWRDIWAAGQGVGSVKSVLDTAALIDRLSTEYIAACGRPDMADRAKGAWGR